MLWLKTVPSTRTKTLAVALEVGADELARRPLQDADDPTDWAEIGPTGFARDAHEDGIAGGGVEGVFLVDANLGAGLAFDQVRPHVADAGSGAAKGPGDGAVRLAGPNGVVLAEFDTAVLEERTQGAAKVGVLGRRHVELAGQRLGLERRIALARNGGEDLIFESGHPYFSRKRHKRLNDSFLAFPA